LLLLQFFFTIFHFRDYYSAGTSALNWRENQFRIFLRPGPTVGSPVTVGGFQNLAPSLTFTNELVTGPPGSGDLSDVYLGPDSTHAYLRGSVGIDVLSNFSIGAAVPNSALFIANELIQGMHWSNTTPIKIIYQKEANATARITLDTYLSPPLSEIIYWLEQMSINLYAEALLKTVAYFTNSSIKSVLPVYCESEHGIEQTAVATMDGSGLSPQNRITTWAIARVLYNVRQRAPWFPSFEQALPITNGIRMKGGFINNVLSYSGYVNKKVFSIITNNFNGPTNIMRQKIWNLLDTLK
jgi:D-alanyl-D-alanine carboxypeptidase/D-alanyl-D-alanine-endopeptidase (penicillin-binding protein 4)